MNRRLLVFALVVVIALMGFSVSAQDAQPQTGGTLVVAAESMGDALDIGFWNGFGGLHVIDSIGEGLVRANYETGEALPGLAESWEISEDGLVYTFNIRQGMVFHDGEPVTAAAVVRSMSRPLNPDDPSYIEGMYMYGNQGTDNWESLVATDEYTVTLTLMQPNATQLLVFTRPDGYIISPKAMDEYGTEVGLNMSMAGPFKVERFVPGQEAVLVANEDYWAGRPYLDQIIIRAYPDEASILAALEAGEVDLTLYAPFTSVPRIQADENDGMNIAVGAPLVTLYFGINPITPELQNPQVRAAINYAIDRETLIAVALNGLAQPPASILAPNDLGYDPAGEAISTYDPERAAALLAESGVSLPVSLELSFENNRFWPQVSELIAADLEAVGFDVTLDRLDTGTFFGKVGEGLQQLAVNQRSTFLPDPHDKALILHSVISSTDAGRPAAYTETAPQLDALIEAGAAEVNRDRRIEIYQELQALVLQTHQLVFLGYLTPPIFISDRVQNVDTQGTAAGRVNFRGVWLSQ